MKSFGDIFHSKIRVCILIDPV